MEGQPHLTSATRLEFDGLLYSAGQTCALVLAANKRFLLLVKVRKGLVRLKGPRQTTIGMLS
jgi:hypothetical protein